MGTAIAVALVISSTVGVSSPLEADTWRILALRVDFPTEDPDEWSTTGRGSFDLRSVSEALPDYTYPYDLPPHDRIYFEHHLEALSRYYHTVSEGQVSIEYDVFPKALSKAYTLPASALSYGNGRTSEEVTEKWLKLIKDAVVRAKGDTDGPDFSKFDSYLFFHAGAGHETGELNDIRSVFLSRGDIVAHGSEPIVADGVEIDDVWILPEAVSSSNVYGRAGLNGLLAKFFGHQIGLPGLSNFFVGAPGVGGWSLMDVGPNRLGFLLQDSELQTLFGFVPPHPIAWSKARLGWIDPLVVRQDTTVVVVATDRPADPGQHKAVKIPISATEYFLIENRQRRGRTDLPEAIEVPFEGIDITWLDPGQIEFSGASDDRRDTSVDPETGVWLGVEEYDAFIPGSGILIWHIDDAVIASQELDGAINDDRISPGIVLEEADGQRDIGNTYFDRQDVTEGSAADPFFSGEGRNGFVSQTIFGPDTTPNTSTNTGVSTGVRVEVLSPLGDTMIVRVSFERQVDSWPVAIPDGKRLQSVDLNGNGIVELVAESSDGLRIFLDGNGRQTRSLAGGFLAATDGVVFASSGDSILAHTIVEDTPNWSAVIDGEAVAGAYGGYVKSLMDNNEVVAVASQLQISLIDATTGQLLAAHSFSDPISFAVLPTVSGENQLLVTSDRMVSSIDADGIYPLWSSHHSAFLLPSVTGDLDGDGAGDIVSTSIDGQVHALSESGSERWQTTLNTEAAGSPALGDIDADGMLEIAVATKKGLVVLGSTGHEFNSFPVTLRKYQQLGAPNGDPLLADLDADGIQEIMVATEDGAFVALNSDGHQVSGFPIAPQGAVQASPVVADLNGDGVLEVVILTEGFIHAWHLGSLSPFLTGQHIAWGQRGGSAQGHYAYLAGANVEPPTQAESLLPSERVYCYPNPVGPSEPANLRYFLRRPANVQLEIFDAIGTRVDKQTWSSVNETVPGENEITWSTENYDSGLYLCRLEARGIDGEREHVIIRMAVIR